MPTTRRVPSGLMSLTAFAAAHRPVNGSWIMPVDADQKYAVLLPEVGEVLEPTTSPLALISRAQLSAPPSVPSCVEPPPTYQITVREQPSATVQPDVPYGVLTLPVKSPILLAPLAPPGRASSCSICHCPATDLHRTGTEAELVELGVALPPTIVPSP